MMKKWQQNRIFGEPKDEPLGKKSKNDGFRKFLGHVSPTFDDSSDPLGHKKSLWPGSRPWQFL